MRGKKAKTSSTLGYTLACCLPVLCVCVCVGVMRVVRGHKKTLTDLCVSVYECVEEKKKTRRWEAMEAHTHTSCACQPHAPPAQKDTHKEGYEYVLN